MFIDAASATRIFEAPEERHILVNEDIRLLRSWMVSFELGAINIWPLCGRSGCTQIYATTDKMGSGLPFCDSQTMLKGECTADQPRRQRTSFSSLITKSFAKDAMKFTLMNAWSGEQTFNIVVGSVTYSIGQ